MSTRSTGAQHEIEIRSCPELRAVNEDGTFEGYIAVWDTVDDYTSTFARGAFRKTIQERGGRVKVFYDHEHLVGRSLEIQEDDHGVRVRGKLNLAVDKAKEAYEFMRDKTLDGLSFGFRTIKERFTNGVREILEVQLFEYGPVAFPANDAAVITDVRARRIIDMANQRDDQHQHDPEHRSAGEEPAAGSPAGEEGGAPTGGGPEEERSTDFGETLSDMELSGAGNRALYALEYTLDDILWSAAPSEIVTLVDDAIAQFHATYLEWVQAYVDRFRTGEQRAAACANPLTREVRTWLATSGKTIEQHAAESSFTVEELRTLQQGRPIAARTKLNELPEAIRAAHQQIRREAVEALLTDLRAGFTPAETRRLQALLRPVAEVRQSEPESDEQRVVTFLSDFRKSLEG